MSTVWPWLWLVIAAGCVTVLRIAFVRGTARSAVDHYYWLLAAQAYRRGGRLPVSIPGKYLLEDEQQSYPPAFGWFLSRLPQSWLSGWRPAIVMQMIDAATLLVLLGDLSWLGTTAPSIAIAILVFGSAPILVVYNTQLTSRALGNLFFTVSVLSLVRASAHASGDPSFAMWFAIAAIGAALTILTHKMTTQLMLALWPLWPLVLDDFRVAAIVPTGLLLSIVATGPRFAYLQWRAHFDIVSFWHRHRDWLGAHPFMHSPIYGDPARARESAFHRPGWRGWLSHAARAFGYCPLLWLAPLTSVSAPWPPGWLLVWALGSAVVALLTLYVPFLRCLGGGHLYVFNAVGPAALWWAEVVPRDDIWSLVLFSVGCVLTIASLYKGYRLRSGSQSRRDGGFEAVVQHLRGLPRGRLAVFPLTAADELAYRTHHSLLWGGHGYGFRRLEPIFPVVRERLADVLRRYRCNWLLYDANCLADCAATVMGELTGGRVKLFGRWVLVTLATTDEQIPASAPVAT